MTRRRSARPARSSSSRKLVAPSASAPVTSKADFLELTTFAVADRNRSVQDLIQLTRRSGTIEAVIDPWPATYRRDAGAEASQAAADDAFAELDDRFRACGEMLDVYPFQLLQTSIQSSDDAAHSVYTFLLLLSQFGPIVRKGLPRAERLFEELCRCAAEEYFGGQSAGVEAVCFGFPRRVLPRRFIAALDQLCKQMGDAVAYGKAPRALAQKDAKLDIVVWKHFPDRRSGKLLAFGQCAAGKSEWRAKATELQPTAFFGKWLRERPSVDPIRLFFVPHRLDRDEHRHLAFDGGILFDRCRLAYFARHAPQELRERCRRWSAYMIRTKLVA